MSILPIPLIRLLRRPDLSGLLAKTGGEIIENAAFLSLRTPTYHDVAIRVGHNEIASVLAPLAMTRGGIIMRISLFVIANT